MTSVEEAVLALQSGKLAVIPTDTVYGLVCTAFAEQPAVDLYRLKGRNAIQPTALLAASVEALLEAIPELGGGRLEEIMRALLPGPFTLVVANPAHRFGWLAQGRPETIGVRVPTLGGAAAEIVRRLGAVAATSANLAGGPDPFRLADVPAEILAGVSATIDGGDLPGVPSTVIDVTGSEPLVLRAGAGDPRAAFARIGGSHTECLPGRDGTLTGTE